MFYSWTPPHYIRKLSEADHQAVREKFHILVGGEDPVPPIKHFRVSQKNNVP